MPDDPCPDGVVGSGTNTHAPPDGVPRVASSRMMPVRGPAAKASSSSRTWCPGLGLPTSATASPSQRLLRAHPTRLLQARAAGPINEDGVPTRVEHLAGQRGERKQASGLAHRPRRPPALLGCPAHAAAAAMPLPPCRGTTPGGQPPQSQPGSYRCPCTQSQARGARCRHLLMVDCRIKVRLDLQADKSPVVVKGLFFP
jgi:hypothetical protein